MTGSDMLSTIGQDSETAAPIAPGATPQRGSDWLLVVTTTLAIVMAATAMLVAHSSAAFAGAPTWDSSPATVENDYKLGALDKVRVRVFEWRPSRDEVFEWAALNAEYTIGGSGKLSLPLIGEILAAGLSTADLGKAIGDRLKDRMGLVASPDASVEMIQFRPFYVTGQVEKPGEYPYRPGITLLQALTISGGLPRGIDIGHMRLEREVIASKGELELLAKENSALLARRARLEAELQRASSIEYPTELKQRRNDPSVAILLDQENLVFKARKHALETQLTALNQLKNFLEKEVESLAGQLDTQHTQLKLMKQELDTVTTLSEKGLTTAPRRMALERNVAGLEGDRLRLETNLLRARQEISRTEISILELYNKRVNEVTAELQQTQARLEQIAQRTETSERLLYESEVITPSLLADRARIRRLRPTYTVFRSSFGRVVELSADESMTVEPGDTVKVDIPIGNEAVAAQPGPTTSKTSGPQRFSQDLLRRTQN
jgi:protein involved in polysaccharide export with SLBB domain